MNFKRVLALSPHTDDAELGAGGTLARLLEEGAEVHYVAFSAPRPELKEECEQALKMLKGPDNGAHIHILDYERRTFPQHRQEILQYLYDFNNKHHPDLVLTPCTYDAHQDHQTVTNEALRCFKSSTIFGYILRWNCRTIKEDVNISIQEHHLQAKIAAISQYFSQLKKRRPYFCPDYHRFEAYVRGVDSPSRYAEAFELIKLVLPNSIPTAEYATIDAVEDQT